MGEQTVVTQGGESSSGEVPGNLGEQRKATNLRMTVGFGETSCGHCLRSNWPWMGAGGLVRQSRNLNLPVMS